MPESSGLGASSLRNNASTKECFPGSAKQLKWWQWVSGDVPGQLCHNKRYQYRYSRAYKTTELALGRTPSDERSCLGFTLHGQ
ncbi:predicted protein [Plenodomus lingam JN3]|uniref:Predicted protein n=1 Tax=Leptosphaeria maculans (strain JN3 / isolate v23.1.3 / race Av1-4-5-6-7-8) TaxID=985895 RepID=E4ZS38_LEPMJ|nr:predicted protein [Plenodomus lingam JN3]CBX94218.1 predicted protein [Plenodomus lingam JN3]